MGAYRTTYTPIQIHPILADQYINQALLSIVDQREFEESSWT